MERYIAVLRGINVGGHKKILMADLKQLLTNRGYADVQTYIQSGNIVFDYQQKKSATEIEADLYQIILDSYSFEVPVMVRNLTELKEILSKNPYEKKAAIENLYLCFLQTKPEIKSLEKIKDYRFLPDDFTINDRTIYIYCAGRFSDTKYNNAFFEKHLKVEASTRNWKTINKLFDMATKD